MSYLGIDLGTSGLRAVLVDGDGQVLGSAEASYAQSHPHPGWSEQDPADWVRALEQAVAHLRAEVPAFADLAAIGVAGHMHGATLLDAAGKALRPCILWNDTRAHAEAAALDADPAFRATTGNIVFAGFTAPKLDWVRRNEPDLFAQVDKVLLPAAYLNLYLTGDTVSDMSDSAGSAWLDTGARDWSDGLLAATHLTRHQMPRLVEGSAQAGWLRPALAQSWGLTGKVVIAGGAGDNAAAACGIGALDTGEGFVSLGTSGVLLAARDGYHPAPASALHTFCHAVPGRWYQMGVMLSATDSLNWLCRILGTTAAEATGALGRDLVAPGAELFLPYLSGERTPHNDSHIRGGFAGLSQRTDQPAMVRAVLEGVAFGLRDSAEALRTAGARLDRVFAIGGGAASRYWLRLIATVLDLPLHIPAGQEFGAALGAARLGMMATGVPQDSAMAHPDIQDTIEPDPTLTTAFDDAFQRFRTAYPALRTIG